MDHAHGDHRHGHAPTTTLCRRGLGFDAAAWTRAGLALAFCAAAWAMVWLIERPAAVAPPAAAPAATAERRVRLAIESTYPVRAWAVTVIGRAQAAERQDAWVWEGMVTAPAGEDVLVRASAADGAPRGRCLRLRLGDDPERVVWGGGDVTATLQVP